MAIKQLISLYNRLQEVDKRIVQLEEDIRSYRGCGVSPEANQRWLDLYITEKSEILIKINKLEKADIVKDVLILLHNDKVLEAIDSLNEYLEEE